MTIFNHAIKRLLGSKVKLLVLLALPVLFAVMFVGGDMPSVSVAVVDNDQSPLSEGLIDRLNTIQDIKIVSVDDSAVDDLIVSYQINNALIIPRGFGSDIIAGRETAVEEFYITQSEQLYYIRALVNNYIADIKMLASGAGYEEEGFAEAFAAYRENTLSLNSQSSSGNWVYQTMSGLGFLVQFMLYMAAIAAGLILEDKSSGVFYRSFFAPVSLKRYFSENLLAFTLVGILQVVFCLSALRLFPEFAIGDNPVLMYLLFIVYALVCISMGMWMVSLFKKPLYAYAAIVFLSMPMTMLGGCFWPVEYMPDILVKIGKFMPTTWVMQGADTLLAGGAGLGDIVSEILILLLFAGIFMAAGLVKKVDVSR